MLSKVTKMSKAQNRIAKLVALFLRDGGQCHLCGFLQPIKQLTLDHILPRSQGGRAVLDNLKLACRDCNCLRGNLSVEAGRDLIETQRTQSYLYGKI